MSPYQDQDEGKEEVTDLVNVPDGFDGAGEAYPPTAPPNLSGRSRVVS